MTTREFYVAVANFDGISADLATKANELIAGLDHKNELRKSSESKAKKETAGRRNVVLAYLMDNKGKTFTRVDLAVALGITDGQATSACTALIKEGLVTKSKVKIDKAEKVVYSIAE